MMEFSLLKVRLHQKNVVLLHVMQQVTFRFLGTIHRYFYLDFTYHYVMVSIHYVMVSIFSCFLRLKIPDNTPNAFDNHNSII